MLKTILALALSAAIMAALGAVGVHVLAGTEAGFLQAHQHALRAEAALAESEMRRLPWEPRRVTAALVADPNLGSSLRALVATVDMLDTATNAKLVKALQARADQLNHLLKQTTDAAHKRMPEADTVALLGADGVVLYAESGHLALGDNARDPGPGKDKEKDKEPVPEWLTKALAGTAGQTGIRVGAQAPFVWFVSAEPVFVKGKVAGVALAEVPLRKPPPGLGSQVLLSVDSRFVYGKPPAGFAAGPHLDAGKAGTVGTVEIVAPREIEAHAGAFSMPIVEVEPEHMGVWGARFRVPGTERVSGWVLQDLSEDYSDLGERQLQVTVLAGMGWFVLAMLYSFVAFSQRSGQPARAAAAAEPARADERREMQADELMAATEPESPWGDLPLGAVETTDDGYQPIDSFDLGDAGAGYAEADATGDEAPQQASRRQRPAIVLGDLLETVVPEQADDDGAGGEWSEVRVSPESAAAAFEPVAEEYAEAEVAEVAEETAEADDFTAADDDGDATRLFKAPQELIRAADRAVAETAPQGASARDQLLTMLQSKKKAPAPAEEAAPLELHDADALDMGEPPLELEEPEAADPQEAARQRHYREVYEEFVKLRRSCNEPGELPYDKFLGRLTDTRSAVMAKHGCEDVAFAAYVKNGKAALKATPR